jgi:hypothetical protein
MDPEKICYCGKSLVRLANKFYFIYENTWKNIPFISSLSVHPREFKRLRLESIEFFVRMYPSCTYWIAPILFRINSFLSQNFR